MTLKELRISKGLTQAECAQYLGMTSRNYHNYESGNLDNTVRYNAIYSKLESFSINNENNEFLEKNSSLFSTNVVIGDDIKSLCKNVVKFKKRECFKDLKKFVLGSYEGKICILYGLRRTGKTTLLFQMLSELPNNKCSYIKIQSTDTMANLSKDLKLLNSKGCKYVFIDEITLMEDFINTAAVLSDIFSMMGMKIVLSGTDSLGFAMASRDELYDRNIMIHTSYISYKEYERLLNIQSIDSYIEYGGTLKMENMSFDDPDSIFDDVSFRDDESTRKYIDTAISRNIQHTLKNDKYGEYFNHLRELYEKKELTNVINRIVENMNHRFLLSVFNDDFESHDFGSAKNLLLHDAPQNRAYVLYDVDKKTIIERLKRIVEIKEKEETEVLILEEHIEQIKKYLLMLDLIVNCPDHFENGKVEEHYVFTQPGMRFAIAKALVYSLMQDDYFRSISENDKNYIINKILDDVKGRMLEEIVLLETKVFWKQNDVFKFKFDNGGEFDMVVYDRVKNTCQIYEVKHSDKIVKEQRRYLEDVDRCNIIEKKYGKISGKYVIYRGENNIVGEIEYLNVEKYLADFKRY